MAEIPIEDDERTECKNLLGQTAPQRSADANGGASVVAEHRVAKRDAGHLVSDDKDHDPERFLEHGENI